jgi:chemotaxis protein methyltransferase CheR
MTPLVDSAAVQGLRSIAVREFGLRFGDDKRDFLADALRQGMDAARVGSAAEYLALFSSPSAGEELRRLAAALTVPETYFFRGTDQLRAFREHILPERIRLRGANRELHILSAGCATGEEPYTLAMILSEAVPDLASWRITLTGLDLNPHLLAHAARARYSSWSLRETTPAARDRYFSREGVEYVVHEVYRRQVTFRQANLSNPPADVFVSGRYDVIFCRNVIMYFTTDIMRAVVERFAHALAPGGYLFLGHAETLRGLSSDFTLHHSHESFYYQKRDGAAASPVPEFLPAVAEPALPPVDPAPDLSWLESIRSSSERMETLARGAAAPAPSAAPAAAGISTAIELLRQERFREALDLVAPLAASSPKDLDALLLQAVLLSHCGRPRDAEAACEQLLRADDLNAEAHHLIAICREHAADIDRAIEQNRVAQYLDPAFAMPYVHVGRLARRKGDLVLARRQLEQGLELLAREEPSRLLLFGGGFSREALMQLCRSELAACGGRP